MIDPQIESPLTLARARGLPALCRDGRRPAIQTMFRWTTRGCRGVILESIQVGGSRCTTVEAVMRFIAALSGHTVETKPTSSRRREIDAAERELSEAGFEVGAD